MVPCSAVTTASTARHSHGNLRDNMWFHVHSDTDSGQMRPPLSVPLPTAYQTTLTTRLISSQLTNNFFPTPTISSEALSPIQIDSTNLTQVSGNATSAVKMNYIPSKSIAMGPRRLLHTEGGEPPAHMV